MRRYINKTLLIAGLAVLVLGCRKSEDFPLDKTTIQYVFDPLDSAGVNAQSYLYGVYAGVKNGHNRVGGDYLDAATDDAVSSKTGTVAVNLLATAGYNSASFPANENYWEEQNAMKVLTSSFTGIRKANVVIANIGLVPVKGASETGVPMRYVWKSEARFLRAWYYFEALKRYGGVPIIGDKIFTIQDDVALPRNTFDECVKYIVKECDAIKDSLILKSATDNYRATKGAAMALKARVLLYAASPLFNGGNIDGANPLTGYTNYDATRWTQAAQAAQDVMNLANPVYSLVPNFKDVFTVQSNPEIIFLRPGGMNASIESTNGPVGFSAGGSGNTSPTQDLVDAFPMENGLPITDPASGYNFLDPYANFTTPKRDPRFEATILHNGSKWLNTELQTYEGGISKPNLNQQQTVTGYYMRKFMGASENSTTLVTHATDWIAIRYAEILLAFAEARNEVETAPQADVYAQLYAIRKRAGILPGAGNNYGLKPNMTQAEMRDVIRNEWRIEFAFEEHRYFDLRRWKLAQTVLTGQRTGVSIVKIGSSLTYNPINVLTTVFTQKQYLYPIPYNEVAKNSKMKQNPGW